VICYRTTWRTFVKYWQTFLIAKPDLIVVSLTEPKFVRMMDSGVVYTGRRNPISAYDTDAALTGDLPS